MNQDEYFDVVARELLEGAIHPGTWTRAIAEANGDKEQAKATYIRIRVASLEYEHDVAKSVAAEKERKERVAKCLRISRSVLDSGMRGLIIGLGLLCLLGTIIFILTY